MKRALVLLAGAAVAGGIAFAVLRSEPDPGPAPAASAVEPPAARAHDRQAQARSRLTTIAGQPDAARQLEVEWNATGDQARRVAILDAAVQIPDRSGLDLLVGIATSRDPLAAHAGAALGRIRHRKLAPELAKLAASGSSVLVQSNAARALGASGTQNEVGVLVALVAEADAPPRVRQEAALALARIGDSTAVAALGKALDDLATAPTGEQLRISIVRALGGIGSATAIEILARHQARTLSATEHAFVTRALTLLKQTQTS